MDEANLASIARSLIADGRGILAADESTGTITKRFDGIGVESTEENRRSYRELLFTTPGLGEFVSGAILYDETIRQAATDGTPIPALLAKQDIHPGIKVDTGAKPLAGSAEETVTEGLDGLRERVAEYHGLGARFAKWRAVIKIGDRIPTPYCIEANAHALARYARLCQDGGLVPIVEPEVLMDGDHDIDRCDAVTTETLHVVFAALHRQGVSLEGMLLKPNMVISGKDCSRQADVDEVAERTVRCLRRTVPAAVPGIVFLSGGQSEQVATAHLNAMNAKFGGQPWALSFSYGRALQDGALKSWKGSADNTQAAQTSLATRAKLNSAAAKGAYTGEAA
ncbi:MAG: fructose-bisphosphate aldolase class I [Rhodospirillales bacterium]|jgi:fructose-bisphosphate aldolase class I|nr:fructose-bisphosphate aldolase class I [Rhodospirillales bacterium]MDP6883561.1 fructose-bisphosphate aldolase class I [Rhodospirillales bacterium]